MAIPQSISIAIDGLNDVCSPKNDIYKIHIQLLT